MLCSEKLKFSAVVPFCFASYFRKMSWYDTYLLFSKAITLLFTKSNSNLYLYTLPDLNHFTHSLSLPHVFIDNRTMKLSMTIYWITLLYKHTIKQLESADAHLPIVPAITPNSSYSYFCIPHQLWRRKMMWTAQVLVFAILISRSDSFPHLIPHAPSMHTHMHFLPLFHTCELRSLNIELLKVVSYKTFDHFAIPNVIHFRRISVRLCLVLV